MNLRDIFLAGAFAQGGGGAVSPEQITEAVNNYLDKNPVGVDLAMTGAAVGQIAKITAVDASGVPTAWEPVDLPKGEEWEQLMVTTTEEGTAEVLFDAGAEKRLKKAMVAIHTGGNGLSAAATIGVGIYETGYVVRTSEQINTWRYPVFMIDVTKPGIIDAYVSDGEYKENKSAPVYRRGSGYLLEGLYEILPFRYIRVAPVEVSDATFNANVKIVMWGVYA